MHSATGFTSAAVKAAVRKLMYIFFILRDLYKVVVEDLVEAGHRKLCFGKVCKPATIEVIFQMLEK
jgi:hypothetical protein